MRHRNQIIKPINSQIQRQSGYVLILTVMFLLILMGTSSQFYVRSLENTRLSGVERDKDLSFLTAEAAMNDLFLRVANDVYDAGPLSPFTTPDPKLNKSCLKDPAPTACLLTAITPNLGDSKKLHGQLPTYIYHITTVDGMDTPNPGILQGIANGESQNVAFAQVAASSFAAPALNTDLTLRINDLYSATKSPISYRVDGTTGSLTSVATVSPTNFDTMGNIGGGVVTTPGVKAAAWLEFTPGPIGTINIYVQAVAQVGDAITYLQQLIIAGATLNTLSGNIQAISEAN